MRVVFFGNAADYSPPFLSELARRSLDPADHVDLVGVVCPQRFAGRGDAARFALKRRVERIGPIAGRAGGRVGPWRRMHLATRRAGAPILWPRTTADPAVVDMVRQAQADVVVVAGLDRILAKATIAALPPTYNIHPSLLPAYRGGVPEFWQLARGETRGGVTLHRIDPGIDTGPVVAQQEFDIPPWFDAAALVDASAAPGRALMNDLLDTLPDVGESPPPPPGSGSYHPLPTEADRALPLDASIATVVDRARAVGWDAPLTVDVSRVHWLQGATTSALDVPAGATVRLLVRDPIPFADADGGVPGTIVRSGAGLVVSCDSGVVLFRTVEES